MDTENDEMMNIYAESALGQYIEPAETPDSVIGNTDSNSVLDAYFSRGGSAPSQSVQAHPQPQQVIVENSVDPKVFLSEAIANIYKAYPHMKDGADKTYLKEIKEAIEELI